MNERGLLDLGGGMSSTECHSRYKISRLSSMAIEKKCMIMVFTG